MQIGVPKEIKNNEHRVGLIPSSVSLLTQSNHIVFVEENAGADIGFSNEDYLNAGAQMLSTAEEVFNSSELIIKVKEPMQNELKYLNSGHTLFTYLHLAGNKQQAAQLTKTGVRGIAYETVTSADGSLPLLAPMSSIAGQLSLVVGSYHLLKPNKGIGTLIGSFGDIEPRVVTVIGAGVAGTEAIEKAIAANVKDDLLNSAVEVNGVRFIAQEVEMEAEDMKNVSFALRKEESLAMVLAATVGDKALLTVMITDDLVANGMNAGAMIREIAKEIEGGGGGQPFFATAGGAKPSGIAAALEKAKDLI